MRITIQPDYTPLTDPVKITRLIWQTIKVFQLQQPISDRYTSLPNIQQWHPRLNIIKPFYSKFLQIYVAQHCHMLKRFNQIFLCHYCL